MKPFEEVQYIRNKEDERKLIQDLVEKRGMSRQQAKKILNRQLSNKIFKNDVYQVAIEETKALTDKVDIKMIHLSIKRLDRQPVRDWRDLQQIKNELVGPECEGVELYPAESRLVDLANQFHLWVFADPTMRFPVGYTDNRQVSSMCIGSSRQREAEK